MGTTINVEYLSIAEFAGQAKVSKQAIYKQINNKNSQIAPYVLRDGKKTLIKSTALKELYGVDAKKPTDTTDGTTFSTETAGVEVDDTTHETTKDNPTEQPNNPNPTIENQPISTDYIAFLKAQVAELKAEKESVETRLNATIAEKDCIIKDQTDQLAQLARQVADIANKALVTTSQQQYLIASERANKQEPPQVDAPPIEPAKEQKGFFAKLLGKMQ